MSCKDSRLTRFPSFLATICLMLCSAGANSAEIILKDVSFADWAAGELVEVSVWMDFAGQPVLGGGLSVTFDPAILEFQSFTDYGWQTDPTVGSGIVRDWLFGSFSGLSEVGELGRITFRVLAPMCGSTALKVSQAPDHLWTTADGSVVQPVYKGTSGFHAMPAVGNVRQIRVTSDGPEVLQISEVVALSAGIDVATLQRGASATGDGSGSWPGATGGDSHADNAIDGVASTSWPDIFHSDTNDASEFLLVTLRAATRIDALSVFGRRTTSATVQAKDVYTVELKGNNGNNLLTCSGMSADNSVHKAVVMPQDPTVSFYPLASTQVEADDIVTFEVAIDFTSHRTYGGGLDILFDHTALEFVEFTPYRFGLAEFQEDPELVAPGVLEGLIGWDWDALPKLASLGTGSFRVLPAMCGSTFVVGADTQVPGWSWLSAIDTITNIHPGYQPATYSRESLPPVNDVSSIRLTSSVAPAALQVSEVIALSSGADVATLAAGATAAGDGTGPFPGATGGPDHANNAIDAVAPSAWPDIFHSDTTSADEFLLVTLAGSQPVEGLSIYGRETNNLAVRKRDVYDVELLDGSGTALKTCRRQSADNLLHRVTVIPASAPDGDEDGVADAIDNCVLQANPSQADTDGDNIGNQCDADIAEPNDCQVNVLDLVAVRAAYFTSSADANWNSHADFNGDGLINFSDLGVIKALFFLPPGPSALPNDCD